MSLASPMARPFPEQARSLAGFLAIHNHQLPEADAVRICAALPSDPKEAARKLKAALTPLGVPLKHTHALKAVADMRGAGGFLGLADRTRWDIASWVDDAMGVGVNRKLHSKLAHAADDLCARIRDQFEPQHEPWVSVLATPAALELRAVGAHATCWRSVLVATDTDGQPCDFPIESLQRLGERLRRLVEGELHGWVDGLIELANDGRHAQAEFHAASPRNESWLLLDSPDGGRPPVVPRGLQKRIDAFQQKHDLPLQEWLLTRRDTAATSQFAPQGLDVARVETARIRLGLRPAELASAARMSEHDWQACVSHSKLPARAFSGLAAALALASPNELLVDERRRPWIPLPRHDDIGAWLSRLDAVVEPAADGPAVPHELAAGLASICATPFTERRDWDVHPPRALKDVNQQLRFAGLVVTATMGVRFVQDLPLSHTRLAGVSILTFATEAGVLTQNGLLDENVKGPATRLAREDEPIDAQWLARFNAPAFSGEELMQYSDMVNTMRDPDDDDDDRFHTTIHAAVKVFRKESNKGHAATVRMEALSRLLTSNDLDPWVVKSNEADHSMISRPAFEAAARCPLIDVNGRPGFDFRAFYMLCVAHARAGRP